MSLQLFMQSLSNEQLLELQNDLINAGVGKELKGDYKAVFKQKRKTASGRRKKIYAALSQMDSVTMNKVSDAILMLKLR
jgi:hypothetical protein